MFADDRNLFLSNKYINKLFNDMNVELQKISVWFKANNLSLMDTSSFIKEKMSYCKWFTHTLYRQFRNCNRKPKFLGIVIDENLIWKYHIEHVCNKVSKSIETMYRSKNILSKRLMKQLYFSFIHSYLNFANIAWASTNKSNLISLYRH